MLSICDEFQIIELHDQNPLRSGSVILAQKGRQSFLRYSIVSTKVVVNLKTYAVPEGLFRLGLGLFLLLAVSLAHGSITSDSAA